MYFVLVGVIFYSSFINNNTYVTSSIFCYIILQNAFYSFNFIYTCNDEERESLKTYRKKFYLCVLSGAFLALHFASWIASIKMTTISNSTILVSCSPIFVSLANFFILKEKFTSKIFIGISMSIVGTIIIAIGSTGGSTSSMMVGNILAFMGAIFVAGYLVIGGIVRKSVSAGAYVFYCLFCFCNCIVLYVFNNWYTNLSIFSKRVSYCF